MISAEYRAACTRIGAQLRRLALYEDGTEGLPLFALQDQLEDGTEGPAQHQLILLRAARLKNPVVSVFLHCTYDEPLGVGSIVRLVLGNGSTGMVTCADLKAELADSEVSNLQAATSYEP